MDNELNELEKIAQSLDVFMCDYGNSVALVTAAEAIADDLDERNVSVTRLHITLQVDVKHKNTASTATLHEETALRVCRDHPFFVTDIQTIDENIAEDPDFTIDTP